MKKLLFGFLVSLMIQPIWAQDSESLDLEKALQLGLENNFQVKIAVETVNLRQGEIGIGWSAFLPIVDAKKQILPSQQNGWFANSAWDLDVVSDRLAR